MLYRSVVIPPAERTLNRGTENIYHRESGGHGEDRQEGVLTGVDGDVSTLTAAPVTTCVLLLLLAAPTTACVKKPYC